MRIALCDDIPMEQKQFDAAMQSWDPTRTVEKYLNGASLLEAAAQSPPFDLVFLDIYLPGEHGIDIARALQKISPQTGIAFITTSTEHAIDAFSLHALHYLVKPVTVEGIMEVFQRLAEVRFRERKRITLTVGANRYVVFLDQICLLESDNHVVHISLSDGRRLKVRMSFGELERMLDDSFLKINRGIVVNMNSIAQMGTEICVLQDGSRLPIAIRHRAAIRAAYDNYVFDLLSRRKDFREEQP